jgi:hypothetical protein
MPPLATIKEWNLKRFRVSVEAYPESDLDLSWDEDGTTKAGLDDGSLVAFCVKASVFLDGLEVGTDYLGNCVYESYEAFNDHIACAEYNRELASNGERSRCGSYFKDMVREAISQARKQVGEIRSVKVRIRS